MRGVLVKMHPKPAPRGRGLCPRPLGSGFGCILNRIPFKSHTNTDPGGHIYTPAALLTRCFEFEVAMQADIRSLLRGCKAEPVTPEVKRGPGRPKKSPVPVEVPEGLDDQVEGFTVFIFVMAFTRWR